MVFAYWGGVFSEEEGETSLMPSSCVLVDDECFYSAIIKFVDCVLVICFGFCMLFLGLFELVLVVGFITL